MPTVQKLPSSPFTLDVKPAEAAPVVQPTPVQPSVQPPAASAVKGRPSNESIERIKQLYAIDGMLPYMIAVKLGVDESFVDRVVAEEVGGKVAWPLHTGRDDAGRVIRGSRRRFVGIQGS